MPEAFQYLARFVRRSDIFSMEYAFSPAAQAVELDSREAKKVVFQATRVAYRGFAAITYALLFCPLLLQQEMSQVTIYGSDLLILSDYAPSMLPLLSLPLSMACDDSDVCVTMVIGSVKAETIRNLAGRPIRFAAMPGIPLRCDIDAEIVIITAYRHDLWF
ncbi:hypothetical protein Tco_1260208 [Tanacetum coccineum]